MVNTLRKKGYEWCELTYEEVVGENSQVNTLRKRREREFSIAYIIMRGLYV